MTSMFKGAAPAMPAMPEIPKPKPVRMPNENDASIVEASRKTRANALSRRGRMSTIMTDPNAIGSSGKSLGA